MLGAGGRSRLWLALLVLLAAASLALALTRVYQVDEAQTAYMATIVAKKWSSSLYTTGQLHIYPLSILARFGTTSAQTLMLFRVFFWALFWGNAALAVVAAGIHLRTEAGLKALILVGTLAPWWGYALECRHDNILLTGMLCLWILARRTRTGIRSLVYFGLGLLSLALHASLFKSVATWAPLAVLLVALEPPDMSARVKLAGWWLLGAAAGFLLCWAIRLPFGQAPGASEGRGALLFTMSVDRFAPWHTLSLLVNTAPLLAAGMAGLLLQGILLARRRGVWGAWRENAGFPEILLFFVCVLAFLANPTPFPYNLAVLSGGAAVALLAVGRAWLEPGALRGAESLPYLLSLGLVLHVGPWCARVAELFSMGNERQEAVLDLAEAYTGPEDPVFDAIGLVTARRAPAFMWFINLANFKQFEAQPMHLAWGDSVPPVLLPSYRLNYLPPADKVFLASNYVALHKDFWVLGARPGRSVAPFAWNCLRAGRYAVVPLRAAGDTLSLDGKALPRGIHVIAKGGHQLINDPAAPCILAWAGPNGISPSLPDNAGMESLCPVPGGF